MLNFIVRFILIFIISLSVTGEVNCQNPGVDPKALLEKMQESKITSGSVAVIRNGKIIYKASLGFLDREKTKKSDVSTLYNVASVSKSVTAWAVMKLVEDGKITLDDPVNKYLKRWKAPLYKDDTTQITVRMLLSHTAGLNMGPVPDYPPGKILPSLPEAVKDLTVIKKPGTGFQYSGGGFMLLQLLIEDVTGLGFEDYMKKAVFVPLGMVNSTFRIPHGDNVATAYDETLKASPHYRYVGVSAAGLYTSIDDLSKFVIASMGIAPNPVLKKATLDLMKTKNNNNYGLGYYRQAVDSATVLVGHGGAALGWRASYYLNDQGDGIVLLSNSSFEDFMNLGLCQWIQSVYHKESQYCKVKPYTSLFIDLFTKGKDFVKKRIETIKAETGQSPIDENFCNIMGYWMLRLERFDGAKTFFELNVLLFPDNSNVHDSMGEFYQTIKNNKKALFYYRKALKIDPDNKHASKSIELIEKAK